MTRSADSSAPAHELPDYVDFSWRRLLLLDPNRRAKAIPLRETNIAAHVPTVMRTNDVASIDVENGGRPEGSQCPKIVQWKCTYVPDEVEQKLLTALAEVGRATPAELAPLIKRSVTWTTKRCAKLAAKQLVVGKPGRNGGYALMGGGR